MIVSIHQPDFIPYLGYFYKIYKSDVFVFLDDVQFSNDNMHHWNRIKSSQGELRLKIPVDYNFGDKINEVRTKDEMKWKEKHLKTIELNYRKSRFFYDIYPEFSEVILCKYSNLAEMNIAINRFICEGFGFKQKFIKSSDLGITQKKEELVIDICVKLGGSVYYSGHGASIYQNRDNFHAKGIKLEYTDFQTVKYFQLWNSFIPNLSVLDYLFNYGFDWSKIDKQQI